MKTESGSRLLDPHVFLRRLLLTLAHFRSPRFVSIYQQAAALPGDDMTKKKKKEKREREKRKRGQKPSINDTATFLHPLSAPFSLSLSLCAYALTTIASIAPAAFSMILLFFDQFTAVYRTL